ncbi:M61 family metallopeptidase [Xanthomarina spongicola]|uniref:Putative metalloprotease with PDZ domain n=1 Tax=Xanthomarina spongicola TaxID=570520 RepID=A0A316DSQ9_9FLAO|nr:PDZ domain-containing protein [Xanthomarina spongicola]PWK20492.1 putative metalloprotease with PDZ domain [Xanthomarina spongicola]
MQKFQLLLIIFLFSILVNAQVSSKYDISFENAIHHEASIQVTFTDLKSDEVEFRMSRSSPGRYAIHEFAKNVYNVKVTDGKGNLLKITRPNPYAWYVSGHDGTIKVSYTLFANHGDGTYAQIDETHAHLNMPATFMYVPELSENEMEITFNVREDLNWKVATQLKHLEDNTYYAKNLQYFMDSPTEITNYRTRSFQVDNQIVKLILHDDAATNEDLDTYFDHIKKVVLQQKAIYGELPVFDYGEYTFLACYMPNATGDGMEHRNSTYLVSTRSLAKGGINQNIGTASHEFFHCWNVERIRPKSLEPFNFEEANMSGELWFAEGFTSYYDDLTLCRAGIISQPNYITGLTGAFNYVWNSPGRDFFNPIEMSYQAPFVDAAKSVDETNRENTFISYYSYGSMLGLALDLSLREKGLSLDDYMKLVWQTYGKTKTFYTIANLNETLNAYAGKDFGNHFFNNYIYKSGMPDFKRLFETVGVNLSNDNSKVDLGVYVRHGKLMNNPRINSSAYNAGLQKGDKLIKVGATEINEDIDLNELLTSYKVNDTVDIVFERFGETKTSTITLQVDTSYTISLMESDKKPLDKNLKTNRENWLQAKE